MLPATKQFLSFTFGELISAPKIARPVIKRQIMLSALPTAFLNIMDSFASFFMCNSVDANTAPLNSTGPLSISIFFAYTAPSVTTFS